MPLETESLLGSSTREKDRALNNTISEVKTAISKFKSNKGLLGDLKADFRRELSVTKIKDVYPKAKSKEEKEMVEAINSLSLGFRFLDDKKDEKGITRNRKNDLIKLAGLVKGIIAAVQQSLLVVNDDHPHVRHLR